MKKRLIEHGNHRIKSLPNSFEIKWLLFWYSQNIIYIYIYIYERERERERVRERERDGGKRRGREAEEGERFDKVRINRAYSWDRLILTNRGW